MRSDASSVGHVGDAASVGCVQQNDKGFRCRRFLPIAVAKDFCFVGLDIEAAGKPGSMPHQSLPIDRELLLLPDLENLRLNSFDGLTHLCAQTNLANGKVTEGH